MGLRRILIDSDLITQVLRFGVARAFWPRVPLPDDAKLFGAKFDPIDQIVELVYHSEQWTERLAGQSEQGERCGIGESDYKDIPILTMEFAGDYGTTKT